MVAVAGAGDGTRSIVGTAVIHPNRGGGGDHVANASFVVDPARSGGGIGRALGEAVLARATADGYLAMQFNAVVESNTSAVRLWRSLGFEILTTVPEAFRHPRDGYVGLHIMWRRLGDGELIAHRTRARPTAMRPSCRCDGVPSVPWPRAPFGDQLRHPALDEPEEVDHLGDPGDCGMVRVPVVDSACSESAIPAS